MHRLEEWYPDALVLRERDEARGAAVVRDERRERDGAGEAHRTGEPERLGERAQTRVVLRLIAVRADEDEDRLGVDTAAVVREHADEVVLPLVRRDPSDEEQFRVDAGEERADVGVGLDVVARPVDEDRHGRRLRVAGVLEALPVEFTHADGEVDRRRELRELTQPKPGVRRGVRVDADEEVRRGHVVEHKHAPRRDLRELVEDGVAH